MSFIAYVYSDLDKLPYMEPIEEEDLAAASAALRRIISQHAKARFAELCRENTIVLVMGPDGGALQLP